MSDCIEWSGRRTDKGYGRLGGLLAHRIAWERANGPIPDGLTLDHICFNPPCVNVAHLRLMSLPDNGKNQRSTYAPYCVNGHEYTPENTYLRPARGQGRRDCRTCIRERVARYKSRRTAA